MALNSKDRALGWTAIAVVSVILILAIITWITPNEPYVVRIEVCNSTGLDLDLIKVVCVNHCTEKFSYEDDLLKQCYVSCTS